MVRLYRNLLSRAGLHRDAYDFLGLNRCFFRTKQYLDPKFAREYAVVNCPLSDEILKQNNVSTLEELRHFIQGHVPENSLPLKQLLRFTFTGGVRFGNLTNVIPVADKLDLRTSYLEESNRRRLHKSQFPDGKLKTLVHLRLGDRAMIKTPWGAYLRTKHIGQKTPLEKLTDKNDPHFFQLTVRDLRHFMRRLISYFDEATFAVRISSDGYATTFKMLDQAYRQLGAGSGLTLDQMKTLRQKRKIYNREFNTLKNKNVSLNVGETPKKLCGAISACVEADLIITAYPHQHRFITHTANFLGHCTNLGNTSLIILLHKSLSEEQMRDPPLVFKFNPCGGGKDYVH